MKQLFTFDKAIWESVDIDDVLKTSGDLMSLGLFKPPFKEFDIQVRVDQAVLAKFFKKDVKVKKEFDRTETFRIVFDDTHTNFRWLFKAHGEFVDAVDLYDNAIKYGLKKEDLDRIEGYFNERSRLLVYMLIVLLTTRNAEKVTEKIKKHGPKSRKRPREYDYITTIKIGKITETMRSEGDGSSTVRPHLRRGHIRNQRVGKGLTEVKSIFIHPVFVNADEKWISNQRKEYRLVA